jgi:decaprenylphospho-beta-D-ribofuranose 2-oxidase
MSISRRRRSANRKAQPMTLPGIQTELTSWSKSTRSNCFLLKAGDVEVIADALIAARARRFSVIAHGAGHSYTDAAVNSGGLVIDLTPMCRILSWDPVEGVMCVEAGVRLRDVVTTAWKDGWWLGVSPSVVDVTVGGCAAMNVNGRNAWKCGPFGATILSLDVLFATGERCTLTPERETQLFQAFVGSMGLLGFITSITLKLQRISSGYVSIRRRLAASLDGIFSAFAEEEPGSDFMEAWLDGFAGGPQLGRGHLTAATLQPLSADLPCPLPSTARTSRSTKALVGLAAILGRPILEPGVQMANCARVWSSRWGRKSTHPQRDLFSFTYWPTAVFAGHDVLFPLGVETFQAFVPKAHAREIFKQLLNYSQRQGFRPIWCIIKKHQRDPSLLSYQVDGFSLELNYQRTRPTAQALKHTLQYMIASAIEADGRFYLAKDHFMTHAQYCQSVGNENVEAFLRLKQRYDPEMLLQSDVFRRVIQPARQ